MKNISYLFLVFTILFSCSQADSDARSEVEHLIDKWHSLSAKADTEYFDLMTDSAVFIGTDKTEVWPKKAFMDFALPRFAEGDGWDFKVLSRNIYSKGGVYWFDEQLDTWMGICQASGVVVDEKGSWKIAHYQLSLTVDNNLIEAFKALSVKEEE